MHTYIGTKMIQATAMNRGDYNEYRGWNIPINENARDEGYLVEYPDSPSNHENHAGYISWSPKKTFEDAYMNLGIISGYLGYQQRVIGEIAQLKHKIKKLQEFIDDSFFNLLPVDERKLLELQIHAMQKYLYVLDKRAEAFNQ